MAEYLAMGQTPKGLEKVEQQSFIPRTFLFQSVHGMLYKLGVDGVLCHCIMEHEV